VQAALDSLDAPAVGHVTLHLLGLFRERVEVSAAFSAGVTLVGDGAGADDALIVFNRSGAAYSTWHSETLRVSAPDVTLVDVAVANDAAGYDSSIAGQSVALHIAVTADRFACFRCAVYGGQDTLYTGGAGFGARSYFADAFINGTCDSIFGGSSSVFERVVLAMSSTATAPRGEPSSAYLFLGGSLAGLAGRGPSFLGRPWGQLSALVFSGVSLSAAVAAPGYQDFNHDCTTTPWCASLLFAEYNSSGAGADPAGRVPWSRQLNASEAALWTRDRVLRGWQPEDALLWHGGAAV
jgi:pectin methylesterase-like acyl-CoA thioesterase